MTEMVEVTRFERYCGLGRFKDHLKVPLDDIYSESLEQKSVLVVGCGGGQICTQALRAGAKRVVGIDPDPFIIAYARTRSVEAGEAVEYLCWNDSTLASFDEQFDVVLCLSELESSENPVELIKSLTGLCGDRLIIGIGPWPSGRTLRRRLQLKCPAWLLSWLKKLPVVFVLWRMPRNRQFVVSPYAVRNVLLYQSLRFIQVDVVKAPRHFQHLIYGKRRRAENIIVLAGPDGAGKTASSSEIIDNRQSEILEKLGITSSGNWMLTDPFSLVLLVNKDAQNIVLDYNLLDPVRGTSRLVSRDSTLQFLSNFNNVYIVTLWATPGTLQKRMQARIDSPGSRKFAENAQRNLEFYREDSLVLEIYRRWFEYCDELNPDCHLIGKTDGRREYMRASIWKKLLFTNGEARL